MAGTGGKRCGGEGETMKFVRILYFTVIIKFYLIAYEIKENIILFVCSVSRLFRLFCPFRTGEKKERTVPSFGRRLNLFFHLFF